MIFLLHAGSHQAGTEETGGLGLHGVSLLAGDTVGSLLCKTELVTLQLLLLGVSAVQAHII